MAKTLLRKLRVFLCHASDDKPKVRELYNKLLADGYDVWLDEMSILPGQDWRYEIPNAVRATDIIVACLSNSSINKSGYVQKEISFALDVADEKPQGTIFIIPVRLEECVVPQRLNRWQWVDLYQEGGYPKLLKALDVRNKELGYTSSKSTLSFRRTKKQNENINYIETSTLDLAEKPRNISKRIFWQRAKHIFKKTAIPMAVILVMILILTFIIIYGPQYKIPSSLSVISASNVGDIEQLGFRYNPYYGHVDKVIFSPNGNIIAYHTIFDIVLVNAQNGLLDLKIEPMGGIVDDIEFSPNGEYIISTDSFQFAFWNISNGNLLGRFQSGLGGDIQISNNGETIINVVSFDDTVEVVRFRDGGFIGSHYENYDRAAISPDGHIIAMASSIPGIDIKLIDFRDSNSWWFIKCDSNVKGLAFSPDGKILASSCGAALTLWNISDGTVFQNLTNNSPNTLNYIVFSHDGRLLASNSYGNTIGLWDVGTGKLINYLEGHFSGVPTFIFSKDDTLLISVSSSDDFGEIRFWRVSDGALIKSIDISSDDVSIALSPDGKLLIVGSKENVIRLWGVLP